MKLPQCFAHEKSCNEKVPKCYASLEVLFTHDSFQNWQQKKTVRTLGGINHHIKTESK